MSNILLVTSSPRGKSSLSTKVARDLADRLQAAVPGSSITNHDLVANPLPHIVPDYTSGIYTPAEARTANQNAVVGVSDAVVDELFAADTIILATGFINFGISSTLKIWIDHISRSGRTSPMAPMGRRASSPARRSIRAGIGRHLFGRAGDRHGLRQAVSEERAWLQRHD